MNAKVLKQTLLLELEAGQPVIITGPPGVGKSDIVDQVCKDLNRFKVDIRALLMDPVDFRGIPYVLKNDDGVYETHQSRPTILPYREDLVIFLDELTAAPPMVQAACYQLVLDKQVGEHKLHPNTMIIAAGNRETDRAVVSRMPTPLANRFVHLELDVHVQSWLDWAVKNAIEPEIIAYIHMVPDHLFQFEPQKNEKAFPTPRSWGKQVNNTLAAFKKRGQPNCSMLLEIFQGSIGKFVGAEFTGFLDIWKTMPNPRMILQNPTVGDVPTKPATLYALSTALAKLVDKGTMGNMAAYGKRLRKEFETLMVTDAVRRDESLKETEAYIEWAVRNQDIIC